MPIPPSEVIAELTERRQRKEPPVLRGNLGLLEAPRVLVRNVDGVKSGLERWNDVGPGRVSNHPGPVNVNAVSPNQVAIAGDIFLFGDYDSFELIFQPGSPDLEPLLLRLTLRKQQEAVSPREID